MGEAKRRKAKGFGVKDSNSNIKTFDVSSIDGVLLPTGDLLKINGCALCDKETFEEIKPRLLGDEKNMTMPKDLLIFEFGIEGEINASVFLLSSGLWLRIIAMPSPGSSAKKFSDSRFACFMRSNRNQFINVLQNLSTDWTLKTIGVDRAALKRI